NVQTGLQRLLQSQFHDLLGNTFDLDVHLQCGNAIGGTGHFEVHVAEVIFVAEDVGENSETLALLHQTHRDTGYRRFQRHTSVHHRQTADAHRSHRAGAIRLGDFRHDANRVRELIALRQHRRQTATGETAVTDLATTRAAHAASFTN